jgi:ADP-ribosyl-[dinitrogen reductase] hydrolase
MHLPTPNVTLQPDRGAILRAIDTVETGSTTASHPRRAEGCPEGPDANVGSGERTLTPATRDRIRGAFLGLAVGDALGTTLEFHQPGSFEPLTDMVGGGPFRLPAGAWTDDTSMAACLAESLIERGAFDPADQLRRYLRWYRAGHLSSTGCCFDIGGTTREALERFEATGDPAAGGSEPRTAANGSLMRLAPVPIAFAADPTAAVRLAGESSRTTHALPVCVDACRYLGALLVGAVRGATRAELLAPGFAPVANLWENAPLHPDIAAVAAGTFRTKAPPDIRGTGYVVASLEAALWAFATTDAYAPCVLAAANLGDDADTTAAIAGQLAGAYYGADAIPQHWLAQLALRERLEGLADGLVERATGAWPRA